MAMALAKNPTTGLNPDQEHFARWLSTPPKERKPPTQQLLALEMGRGEVTLVRWKQIPALDQYVKDAVIQYVKLDKLGPIIYAQVREAEKGSLEHAKWLMEITGIYTAKSDNPSLIAPIQIIINGIDPDGV
jgi:hypothetical protein